MSKDRDIFLKILQRAIQKDASDIHLKTGLPPYFRIDGIIEAQDTDALQAEEIDNILSILLNETQQRHFKKRGELDLAFTEKGVGRFRVNVFRQRGTVSLVLRRIKTKILSFEQLNLPVAALRMADIPRGLVLITGTTGSGKSTALASLIDTINERRRCHIVTIEDPIEFVHQDKRAVINQREVTIDTQDFSSALKSVMRQDPDVILIGEMRDLETFQAAISASETGHLVFSTLHTTNVKQTMDRIIDMFPSTQQQQVLAQLAQNLKAVMCLRLLPRADGIGRVPTVELIFTTPSVRKLIREGRSALLEAAIQQGREDGMQTFNDSLYTLVKTELIDLEEALNASENPEELNMMLQGIRLSSGGGGLLG
ncbi:MAG: PilT/PilU family type 4a pilus ATPase [Candidatus Hydrogenedentes bacterium]|nr:PilT/PilU family type 4a pilus ATPase [Candidatus Hydrogenedentota bacterium]